jgi:hypothetical protein
VTDRLRSISELPIPSNQLYPENPDDVNDWVERRARRLTGRPGGRFTPAVPPAIDTSSSSSSRATSPSSILHSDVFELPASIPASLPTPEDEVDEDELALQAAIALSLEETERNAPRLEEDGIDIAQLNEALHRSRVEQ